MHPLCDDLVEIGEIESAMNFLLKFYIAIYALLLINVFKSLRKNYLQKIVIIEQE